MIQNTILKVTEGKGKNDFVYILEKTYNFKKFRNFINLILTLSELGKIKIFLSDKNVFEDYLGLCQTFDDKKKINFGKNTLIKISDIFDKKSLITIKKIKSHIIFHEFAHCIEKQLKIKLEEVFFFKITSDIKNTNIGNIILKNTLNNIMIEEIKEYKKNHFISELFARYFEIYAYTKEISNESSIPIEDLDNVFLETNKWFDNYLDPLMEKFSLKHIMDYSNNNKILEEKTPKWVDKEKSSKANLKWSERNKSKFE